MGNGVSKGRMENGQANSCNYGVINGGPVGDGWEVRVQPALLFPPSAR